jgi:hypothetical protein
MNYVFYHFLSRYISNANRFFLAISNGIVINLKLDIVNVFFFLDAMQLVNFLADHLSHLLLTLEALAKSIPHFTLAAISHH